MACYLLIGGWPLTTNPLTSIEGLSSVEHAPVHAGSEDTVVFQEINTVEDALLNAAATYNVSYNRLRCLAFRESTMNPYAYNPAGPYYGLMQFNESTWALTPYAHSSYYDEYASASAAAYLISIGQSSRWPVYRFC